MAVQKSSAAYDLSLFETRPRKEEIGNRRNNLVRVPKKRFQLNQKKKIKPLSIFSWVLCSATLISVVTVLVYSQVQLTELTERLNGVSKALQEQQSIHTQLEMKAESKLSLRSVEEHAKNELLMKKIDPSQVECVVVSEGNYAELKNREGDGGLFSKIEEMFRGIKS